MISTIFNGILMLKRKSLRILDTCIHFKCYTIATTSLVR